MKSVSKVLGHRPTTLRVVVAPAGGRVRLLPPRRFHQGREWVEQGQAVARIEQGVRDILIEAPVAGRVTQVLALEGEPVAPGHAVIAIEPEEE